MRPSFSRVPTIGAHGAAINVVKTYVINLIAEDGISNIFELAAVEFFSRLLLDNQYRNVICYFIFVL